ncbi:hypothetical protein C8R47DRAFT_358471 [Mycena vitilis]|nr:hypothetical protein C8R47DRAFT_358471 [Mycena vitilis]
MDGPPECGPDIQQFAATLASIVSAGLEDKLNPLDPLYADKDACLILLSRNEVLHELMRMSNEVNNYGPVGRLVCLRQTKTKAKIGDYLDEIRGPLTKFIHCDHPLHSWTPDAKLEVDPYIVAHIESLEIPAVGRQPGLLIDRLGRFGEDDQLKTRVHDIFEKTKKTFLVNASGSGKTRLSFEGLCLHWGLYFTLARDSNNLGAADSGEIVYNTYGTDFEPHLPPSDFPGFSEAIARNIQLMDERFSLLLLGRLRILHLFSEICQSEGMAEEHKRRWLLFQLMPNLPGIVSFDIFGTLAAYSHELSRDEVQDHIAVILSKLRRIHGPEFHLFIVMDEAQTVSRKYTNAFQHEGKPYPLLREIIRIWADKFKPPESSFVIVGTDIPKDGFENAPFALSTRWCSDTGSFDDEDAHRHYLSRFLAPSYVASPEGQLFLHRAWMWCRGRHRFTDALIKALLVDGFQTPHRLLNDYVQTLTTYRPADYDDTEPFRYTVDVDVDELSPEWFTGSPLLKSTIVRVLFDYLATAQHSTRSEDLTALVSAGYGRFNDHDLGHVVMDEPLMLLRAASWLCDPPEQDHDPWRPIAAPLHNSFAVLAIHRTSLTSGSLAAFLASYLARAIENGSTLSKLFSFPHKPMPKWVDQTAELLVKTGDASSFVTYNETSDSASLLSNSSTLAEVELWLDGSDEVRTPFCLSHTAEPDLLFTVKLRDGRLVRVILHPVVTDNVLQKSALKKIMVRLQAETLFGEDGAESSDRSGVAAKALDTTKPDGPCCVLRVIASFPAKTHLRTLAAPSKNSPVANLNSGLFQRTTAGIPATDLLEQLATAVTTGKRKRGSPDLPEVAHKKPRLPAAAPQSSGPSRTLRTRKGKQRAV